MEEAEQLYTNGHNDVIKFLLFFLKNSKENFFIMVSTFMALLCLAFILILAYSALLNCHAALTWSYFYSFEI